MIEKGRLLRNLLKCRKVVSSSLRTSSSENAATDNSEKTTHFGFKTVKESEKVKEGIFSHLTNYSRSAKSTYA